MTKKLADYYKEYPELFDFSYPLTIGKMYINATSTWLLDNSFLQESPHWNVIIENWKKEIHECTHFLKMENKLPPCIKTRGNSNIYGYMDLQ